MESPAALLSLTDVSGYECHEFNRVAGPGLRTSELQRPAWPTQPVDQIASMCQPFGPCGLISLRFRWLTHTGKGCGGPLGLNRTPVSLALSC